MGVIKRHTRSLDSSSNVVWGFGVSRLEPKRRKCSPFYQDFGGAFGLGRLGRLF